MSGHHSLGTLCPKAATEDDLHHFSEALRAAVKLAKNGLSWEGCTMLHRCYDMTRRFQHGRKGARRHEVCETTFAAQLFVHAGAVLTYSCAFFPM